jgi:hypothetical protein
LHAPLECGKSLLIGDVGRHQCDVREILDLVIDTLLYRRFGLASPCTVMLPRVVDHVGRIADPLSIPGPGYGALPRARDPCIGEHAAWRITSTKAGGVHRIAIPTPTPGPASQIPSSGTGRAPPGGSERALYE